MSSVGPTVGDFLDFRARSLVFFFAGKIVRVLSFIFFPFMFIDFNVCSFYVQS